MAFKDYLEQEIINLIADGKKYLKDSLEFYREAGLPTLKDEHWKYTPLNFLFKNEFHLLKEIPKSQISLEKLPINIYIPDNSNIIIIENGFLSAPGLTDNKNIQLAILGETSIVPETLPNESKITNNIFELINGTFQKKLVTLNLKNETNPLVFINASSVDNAFINPNITINLAENAKSEIYWYDLNFAENNFSNLKLNINLEENSKLSFFELQNNLKTNFSVNNIEINQAENSNLNYFSFLLQAKFSRNNFQVNLNGSGIESKLNGLFIGKNDSIVDNHILMSHNKPHCHSNQFFKGILQDASRGVFNGKVLVQKDAQKTDAYQSNKNILTTREASIFTKPELEIYADDVKCSHGATSGFLQEDELFYLMSRGIGQEESKSLLLKAFANEVIDKVENEDFRDWLYSRLDEVI
jgi:Fe-S cluster assembly protein SufD